MGFAEERRGNAVRLAVDLRRGSSILLERLLHEAHEIENYISDGRLDPAPF